MRFTGASNPSTACPHLVCCANQCAGRHDIGQPMQMKPAHLNLAALTASILIALAVLFSFGPGPVLHGVLMIFSLAWTVQCVALVWSASRMKAAPSFTSVHLLALWAAGFYPISLLLLSTIRDCPQCPTEAAPPWFVLVSIPIGYLMVFGMMSLALWFVRSMAKRKAQRRTP